MSVLQSLTSIAKALLPRNGSTRERAIKVHTRIEGTIEEIDIAKRLITVRKAREVSSRRQFVVPPTCKIMQQSESITLEHLNLYDHVWVVFSKSKLNNSLEALDIEVIS